jgi:hypothetical protein
MFSSFSDPSRRLGVASRLETAPISSTRSPASVWSLTELEAPLGSLGTKSETTAEQEQLGSPAQWQVVLALTVALIVLLRWIHHQVGATMQARSLTPSGVSALKPGDSQLLLPDDVVDAQLSRTPPASSRKQSSRFLALDVLRGVTICLMVFVNYGGDRAVGHHSSFAGMGSMMCACRDAGGGMAAFTHSVWDGLTIADMLFPW